MAERPHGGRQWQPWRGTSTPYRWQGFGWWKASDGRWYPPASHPHRRKSPQGLRPLWLLPLGAAGALAVLVLALAAIGAALGPTESDADLTSEPAAAAPPVPTTAEVQRTTTTTTAPPTTVPQTTTTAAPPTTTEPPPPTTLSPTTVPRPPAPSPSPPPAQDTGCDPNYSGCVPTASDVDCAGGSGNGPEYVAGPVRIIGADPYGLDADGDGLGCED